jgi:integrase
MTNPLIIINRARDLVGVSGRWPSYWRGEQADIAWGQAPAPQFPQISITPPEFSAGFPDVPFSQPSLPAPPAVVNTLQAAAYNGVAADLNVDPVATLSAITYGVAEIPDAVPNPSVPAPPLDYPIATLLTLPAAAGLTAVDLETITVGERPELFEQAIDHFLAASLTPLAANIPEPGALPDPYELTAGNFEEYMADAAFLQELFDAARTGALIDLPTVWEPMVEAARLKLALTEDKDFGEAAGRGFFKPTPGLTAARLNAAGEFRMALEEAARSVREDAKPVEILRPGQLRLLLCAMPADLRFPLAICCLTGIRPSGELRRLHWSMIDTRRRVIDLPGLATKTRQGRTLHDLPESVWRWVEWERGQGRRTGPVLKVRYDQYRTTVHAACKGICLWPQDVTRHSFASYGFHHFGAERTVELMGHIGGYGLFARRYKAAARAWSARLWFSVGPPRRGRSEPTG